MRLRAGLRADPAQAVFRFRERRLGSAGRLDGPLSILQHVRSVAAIMHAPLRAQRLDVAGVARLQFLPPQREDALREFRRQLREPPRIQQERVFIVHLDHGHAGLVFVGAARVRVHMREQLARVVFEHRDERRVKMVHALAVRRPVLRGAGVGSADVQIDVHVDAASDQLGDEAVEFRQIARM